jgi:hypothetical protein
MVACLGRGKHHDSAATATLSHNSREQKTGAQVKGGYSDKKFLGEMQVEGYRLLSKK